MANGFPEGNFRIVNKETGACIASLYGGESHGVQDAVTARGETGVLSYSHTNPREFTVHDKVKNIEEELWFFDSHADSWGHKVNLLFNKVRDVRSRWVLGANIKAKAIADKLQDHDLENFLGLLPKQDEETLAHLRTTDCLDIINLLDIFIYINDKETIKSELVGKLDDKKIDEYLNTMLAYNSIHSIEQKFKECAPSSFSSLNSSEIKNSIDLSIAQHEEKLKAQLYQIIVAALKLDMLRERKFELNLGEQNIDILLKDLKKESSYELQEKMDLEYMNIEDPRKEAIKIILELIKTLDLHTNEKNMNTTKKILQTGLKSNESFEQLQTALNSTTGKTLQSIYRYKGDVHLQGSGQKHLTKWAFEDGYIFVEGQPDAVLTYCWDLHVGIRHRSDDQNQRWELKRA